jgi:hypothetical protein
MNNNAHSQTPDQSGSIAPSATQSCQPKLFTAGDAARSINTSITTIKRISSELRLDVQQTAGGLWLFNQNQLSKIKAEMERRKQEAWR